MDKEDKKKTVAPPPIVKKQVPKFEDRPGFKGIVRIAGKDVKGQIPLRRALLKVRGIGPTLSNSAAQIIHKELGISPEIQVGELDESKIEKIDAVLFNIGNYAVPKYLFNHRGEFNDGADKHFIMNDLIFAVKQDIEREKKSFSWKGYRHSYGQKVRGQRTRNTGRTGMSVGVMRKAVLAAAAAQKDAGKKPAAGAAAPTTEAKPVEKPAEKK